jgi:hypothetical protein
MSEILPIKPYVRFFLEKKTNALLGVKEDVKRNVFSYRDMYSSSHTAVAIFISHGNVEIHRR